MGKILIVDDDPDILVSVEATLSSAGREVIATTEPGEVARLLDKNVVDAMVLDVMMPEISGLDVLKTIRTRPRGKALPVLLLTALGDTEDLVRGLSAGADDYLAKPFKPQELVARVERLISRHSQGTGLTGSLESFFPGDVLQNLAQGNKTGCLELSAEGVVARVHLRDGRIVGARLGRLRGKDAILAILELRSGYFDFASRAIEAEEQEAEEADQLALSNLLLEAAWLEDELLRREADLPAPDRSLIAVTAPSVEGLAEFADLPFEATYDSIYNSPGIDRKNLIALEFASPSRVLLALALMIEQGSVEFLGRESRRRSEGAGDQSLDEEKTGADPLLRLVTDCEQRGFGPEEPIHVLILFQSGIWEVLLALVTSVAAEALTSHQHRILFEQLERRHHGAVPLSHGHHKIFLHLQPLRRKNELQREIHLPILAGVILWLSDGNWDQDLGTFVAKIEAVAQRSTNVVIAPDGALSGPAKASLAALRHWRVSTDAPCNFSDLLQLLANVPRQGTIRVTEDPQ